MACITKNVTIEDVTDLISQNDKTFYEKIDDTNRHFRAMIDNIIKESEARYNALSDEIDKKSQQIDELMLKNKKLTNELATKCNDHNEIIITYEKKLETTIKDICEKICEKIDDQNKKKDDFLSNKIFNYMNDLTDKIIDHKIKSPNATLNDSDTFLINETNSNDQLGTSILQEMLGIDPHITVSDENKKNPTTTNAFNKNKNNKVNDLCINNLLKKNEVNQQNNEIKKNEVIIDRTQKK